MWVGLFVSDWKMSNVTKLKIWTSQWTNLPAKFATRYKNIVPNLLHTAWINNLNLHGSILQFNSIGYTLSYLPTPKNWVQTTLYSVSYIFLIVTATSPIFFLNVLCLTNDKCVIFLNSLKSFNITPNIHSILNFNSELVINKIVIFILEAGFLIWIL